MLASVSGSCPADRPELADLLYGAASVGSAAPFAACRRSGCRPGPRGGAGAPPSWQSGGRRVTEHAGSRRPPRSPCCSPPLLGGIAPADRGGTNLAVAPGHRGTGSCTWWSGTSHTVVLRTSVGRRPGVRRAAARRPRGVIASLTPTRTCVRTWWSGWRPGPAGRGRCLFRVLFSHLRDGFVAGIRRRAGRAGEGPFGRTPASSTDRGDEPGADGCTRFHLPG